MSKEPTWCIAAFLLLPAVLSGVELSDQTAEWNLDFVHSVGPSGTYRFPEITGSGLAAADFNGDGWMDLYLVQSESIDGSGDQLFLNDGQKLTNATRQWEIDETNYGMGAATGDVNGDGRVDLLVTNFGPNSLLINQGDRLVRQSSKALDASEWSTSASFFDADRDGDLDLYIANYVVFDLESNPSCLTPAGRRDYCGPSSFQGQRDRFYLNDGDGGFIDATARFFPDMEAAPGLGVVARDFNGDGWTDVFVANDGAANFLWMNTGEGRFEEDGMFAGVAMNGAGVAEASMGIIAADLDEDADIDLMVVHLSEETNTVYRNDGGDFVDATAAWKLASSSIGYTSWGALARDLNGDNRLDLFIANGAVRTDERQVAADSAWPFGQPDQIFLGNGDGFSAPVLVSAQPAHSARGAVSVDLDNDGDWEIVISNNNAAAQILTSPPADDRSWLGIQLSPSSMTGVTIEFEMAGSVLHRLSHTDGSYASASDPRVSITVPDEVPAVNVKVTWPDGHRQSHSFERYNRYHTIIRTP